MFNFLRKFSAVEIDEEALKRYKAKEARRKEATEGCDFVLGGNDWVYCFRDGEFFSKYIGEEDSEYV